MKPWYKQKTTWFAILSGIGAVAGVIAGVVTGPVAATIAGVGIATRVIAGALATTDKGEAPPEK